MKVRPIFDYSPDESDFQKDKVYHAHKEDSDGFIWVNFDPEVQYDTSKLEHRKAGQWFTAKELSEQFTIINSAVCPCKRCSISDKELSELPFGQAVFYK